MQIRKIFGRFQPRPDPPWCLDAISLFSYEVGFDLIFSQILRKLFRFYLQTLGLLTYRLQAAIGKEILSTTPCLLKKFRWDHLSISAPLS